MMIQNGKELHVFLKLCRMFDCRSYVDLGSYDGSSARLAKSMLAPDASVWSLDIVGEEGHTGGVRFCVGDTRDDTNVARAISYHGGDWDALFIDADHSEESCREDWLRWGGITKKVVGFHDIRTEGVRRVFDEVREGFLSMEIVDYADRQKNFHEGYGIGVIIKPEAYEVLHA